MALMEVLSVVKTYTLGGAEIRALDDVSFSVQEGEKVAIIGPSGSGKSTLMHVLGCLDRPDSGQYVLDGQNVSELSRDELATIRNKKIGFVFQTFNLLPRMSAVENVELPLLYGRGNDARKRAERALEIVGLADRRSHEPSQLSGGERQRIAIARAVVTDPAIILADEPTGNLDSKTGEDVMALFGQLNEQGRTIVIVTHDAEVSSHCERQLEIRDGKIKELTAAPKEEAVACSS